jgi:hypothetical protein
MSGADAEASLSFRARQHGGVPAVVAAHGSGSGVVVAPPLPLPADVGPPDARRCILHLDVDAFYAQVEELRDPTLRDVPMARCCRSRCPYASQRALTRRGRSAFAQAVTQKCALHQLRVWLQQQRRSCRLRAHSLTKHSRVFALLLALLRLRLRCASSCAGT